MIRILAFALAFVAFAASAAEMPDEQIAWFRRGSASVAPSGVPTLIPNAAWNGTRGSGGSALTLDTSVQGQQTITAVTDDGSGGALLTVAMTGNMSSGDLFTISGVSDALDGPWQISVVDATHIRPCSAMSQTYVCTALPYAAGYAGGGTIGFGEAVIANFDEYNGVVVEAAGAYSGALGYDQITIGAAVGNHAWIRHVDCSLEGGTPVRIATPSWSNRGSYGYVFNIASSSTMNGDAQVVCDVYPVHGLARRLTLNAWLDSSPAGANYVNRTAANVIYVDGAAASDPANCTGAGTTVGTQSNPYKTLRYGLNCSVSGAVIYAKGTITESASSGCIGGVCKDSPRMKEVRPWPGQASYTVNLASRGTWNLPTNKVNFNGVILDMATVMVVQGCYNAGVGIPCYLTESGSTMTVFSNCTLTSSDGPVGPTYGYFVFSQSPFLTTFNRQTSLTECSASSGILVGALLYRNINATLAWDALFLGPGVANTAVFNYNVRSPVDGGGQFLEQPQRLTAEPVDNYTTSALPTISSTPIYNGTTTSFTIATSAGASVVNNAFVDFASGALNGQSISLIASYPITTKATNADVSSGNVLPFATNPTTFVGQYVSGTNVPSGSTVTAIDGNLHTVTISSPVAGLIPSGTTITFLDTAVVAGNVSTAAVGDLVYLHQHQHADANQFGILSVNTPPVDLNIYEQRYTTIGIYQSHLIQAGSFQASGTVTSSGKTATFSTTGSVIPTVGNFIHIISGADQGQYRQITAVAPDKLSATIDRAFSPDISTGATWAQGNTTKGFACVSCRMGGTSLANAAQGQFQHPAQNFVFANITTNATKLLFRNNETGNPGGGQGPAFGMKNFVMFDSLIGQSNQGGGAFQGIIFETPFSNVTGYAFDNLYHLSTNSAILGTGYATGSVTMADADYKPTGLTLVARGIRGNPNIPDGTPFFPSIDGRTTSAGALVGAIQP